MGKAREAITFGLFLTCLAVLSTSWGFPQDAIKEAMKLEEEGWFGDSPREIDIDDRYFGSDDGSDDEEERPTGPPRESATLPAVSLPTQEQQLAVIARGIKTSPELPVNLVMSCMTMLSRGGWAEGLPMLERDGLSRLFKTFQQMLEGDQYDRIQGGTERPTEPWAMARLETHPIALQALQRQLMEEDNTALLLYWVSLMCSACNEAFMQCENVADTKLVYEHSSGEHRSEWISILKRAATLSRLSLQSVADAISLGQPIEEALMTVGVAFDANIECGGRGDEDDDYDCVQHAISVIEHKILVLKTIADGDNVCLNPIGQAGDAIDNDFFSSNFPIALRRMNQKITQGRPAPLSRAPKYRDVYGKMSFWAQTFVTQRVCPQQAYRWAVMFSQELDTTMNGAKTTPYMANLRMVFNPLSQSLPWELQSGGRGDWMPLRVEDTFTENYRTVDPFTTAITGLEIWSASQKDFANTMMAWFRTIITRKGVLPQHLGKLLGLLQKLGSKNEIVAIELEDEGVQRIITVEENTGAVMDVTGGALSVPDAISWVNLIDGVEFSDAFASAATGLGYGFSMIATGFFLWNAIFVDNTAVERLYSTMQGGLVWADIFIHIALAAVTNGVWVPIVASASVYVAVSSLFGYLKSKPWFRKRFPSIFEMKPEEFVKIQKARRLEICFASFYSAVFVAENTARDVIRHPRGSVLQRDAMSFDAPEAETLEKRKEVSILFHDYLFSLMDSSDVSPIHNLRVHMENPDNIYLRICGRKIQKSTHYISPKSAIWGNYVGGVEERAYMTCRAQNERILTFRKKKNRIPCSPSEFVLAFYHSIVKEDNTPSLLVRAAGAVDNIMHVIASPTSGVAAIFRDSIVEWFSKTREFQARLFKDQDLGMLNVWFTLHMFHILTFRSTDEREVAYRGLYSKHHANPHQDDSLWLLPTCTEMDQVSHNLVLRSARDTVPSCAVQNTNEYDCGNVVNICTAISDPLAEKNWRLAVAHRALNEGANIGRNITNIRGVGAVRRLRGPRDEDD